MSQLKKNDFIWSLIFSLFALLFFPTLSYAGVCKTDDPYPYVAPYAMDSCPEDIQNWLDRANICAHFSGEEAYDEDRAAEIEEVMHDNQCDYVECDYHELFLKYEGDIVYTGVLTDYKNLIYGGQELFECPAAE